MLVGVWVMGLLQFFCAIYQRIQRAITSVVAALMTLNLNALILVAAMYGGSPMNGAFIVRNVDRLAIDLRDRRRTWLSWSFWIILVGFRFFLWGSIRKVHITPAKRTEKSTETRFVDGL